MEIDYLPLQTKLIKTILKSPQYPKTFPNYEFRIINRIGEIFVSTVIDLAIPTRCLYSRIDRL